MRIIFVDESNVLKDVFKYSSNGSSLQNPIGSNTIYNEKWVNIINKVCLDNRAHLVVINYWSKFCDDSITKLKLKEKGIKVPVIGILKLANTDNRIEHINDFIKDMAVKFESTLEWVSILDSSYTKDIKSTLSTLQLSKHSTEKNVILSSHIGINDDINDMVKSMFN